MNLRIRRTSEGLPEIHIGFDQDTSDTEPFMRLTAFGFDTEEEIAVTLMDIAESLHNNVPAEVNTVRYEDVAARRKLGETVRDVERREQPKPKPFNPQPRGQR